MIIISSSGKLGIGDYIKYTFVLWGVGALSGGIITAICTLGGKSYNIKIHNSAFIVLAAGVLITSGIVRLFSNNSMSRSCTVRVREFENEFEFQALVDSGNLVVDPISSIPVIFISKGVFRSFACRDVDILSDPVINTEQLSDRIKRKIRIVSVDGICDSRIIAAVVPDEVYIIDRSRVKKVRAAFAIENRDDYDGYEGIVPSSLLR